MCRALDEFRQQGVEEGKKEGIKEGKKEGIKLGELKKAKESARAALSKGYSTKVIIDITGLTERQVEEIREEMKLEK